MAVDIVSAETITRVVNNGDITADEALYLGGQQIKGIYSHLDDRTEVYISTTADLCTPTRRHIPISNVIGGGRGRTKTI
jgi:hypothetical protein